MRLALYGGSFDPPHPAHVRAARLAWQALRPDRLLVMPAADPPHKALSPDSPPPEERLALTRLAFRDFPEAEVSDLELRRGGESYTADTVRELWRLCPGAEVTLIVGGDMLRSFETWREAGWLLRHTRLAALPREEGEPAALRRQAEALRARHGARVELLEAAPLPMSSTGLRARLRARGGADTLDGEVYARIIRLRDYGAKPQLDWLREQVRPYMQPKRMAHVLGCEAEAARLAERWGADPGDAAEAALLHDITKRLDVPEQLLLAERYGIVFDKIARENRKLMHAQTGAALARERFGVPPAICDAIRWHTTGRSDMALLEKLLYLADYIEPTRDFAGVADLRRLAYADLDAAVALGLRMSLDELRRAGIEAHGDTVDALAWYGKDKA